MPTFAIKKDSPLHYFAGVVPCELLHIESNTFCVPFKNRSYVKSLVPLFLMFVDHVMHFPEPALQAGCFRGPCGCQRMHVIRYQWKLAEDYAHLCRAVFGFYSFQDWMKHATGWTLEVAKLLQRNRRLRISECVCRFSAGFYGIHRGPGCYWRRTGNR